MISPSAPLDQFSFVDSEEEEEDQEQIEQDRQASNMNSNILISHEQTLPRKSTTDSGVSDCSGQSFTTSPLRALGFEDQEHAHNSVMMYSQTSQQVRVAHLKSESLEEEEDEEEEQPRAHIKSELGHPPHHFLTEKMMRQTPASGADLTRWLPQPKVALHLDPRRYLQLQMEAPLA
uniref:Uncharacterized protein n=1 Tax=Ditylenchus dipsaci TaxID=166011 RepID=A0A915CUD2_9BILA